MTDVVNAEKLRAYYLTRRKRKSIANICRASRNWNGFDYCDVYSGAGCECWKQDAKHNCVHCEEIQREAMKIRNNLIRVASGW